MELAYSRQIFDKYSNKKFLENPSNGSRVVPCGRTDMARLIVAISRTRLKHFSKPCFPVRLEPSCEMLYLYKGKGKVHSRTGHEGPEGE
jgi:hypothetical protein